MDDPNYRAGYGQALADVLAFLDEASLKTVRSNRADLIEEWSNQDTEQVRARLRALETALGWVRAGVKGLRKRG